MPDSYKASSIAGILDDKLGIGSHKLFAITGSGGKTSLMYSLGGYFALNELVLLTTTTKIFTPSLCQYPNQFIGPAGECVEAAEKISRCSALVAAKERRQNKLIGYTAAEIQEISQSSLINKIIVEADGSRGLSLKAYEDWEPPVPPLTSCQIIVFGADAFTIPVSASTVFRFDSLSKRYGMHEGDLLSAATVSAILSSQSEYLKNSPESSYRILFVNKCDKLSETEHIDIYNKFVYELRGYDALVTASIYADTVYRIRKLDRG